MNRERIKHTRVYLKRDEELLHASFIYKGEVIKASNQLAMYRFMQYSIRDHSDADILEGLKSSSKGGEEILRGTLASYIGWWKDSSTNQKAELQSENSLPLNNHYEIGRKWAEQLEHDEITKNHTPEEQVSRLQEWLENYGAWDCRTPSSTSLSTLHIFSVMLDFSPELYKFCKNRVAAFHGQSTLEFVTQDQISKEKDVWMDAFLAVFMGAGTSTATFVEGLAFLQNENIVVVHPHLNLLVGDLLDSQLLGFNYIECILRRIKYYCDGLKCETIKEACTYRLLSLVSLTPQKYLTRIVKAVEASIGGSISELEKNAEASQLGSLIASIDFMVVNPMILSKPNLKDWLLKYFDMLRHKEVLKALKNKEHRILRVARTKFCKGLQDDQLSLAYSKIDSGDLDEACQIICEMLRQKMNHDVMCESLRLCVELLEKMRTSSYDCERHLKAKKTILAFEKLEFLITHYYLERKPLRNAMLSFATILISHNESASAKRLLLLCFLLKPVTPRDIFCNRKALKLLVSSAESKTTQASVFKEVVDYINKETEGNPSEEDVYRWVGEECRQIIGPIKLKKLNISKNDEALLAKALSDETVRPSLSHAIEGMRQVYIKNRHPNITVADDPLKEVLKLKQFFSELTALKLSEFSHQLHNNKSGSATVNASTDIDKSEDPSPKKKNMASVVDSCVKKAREVYGLRVFHRDDFEVFDMDTRGDTFQINDCRVYKSYFISNSQKCTIFEVEYGEFFSETVFDWLATFLCVVHPKIVSYYGFCIELAENLSGVTVLFVAEHFDQILSNLPTDEIIRMKDNRKHLILYDILTAMCSFHAIGIGISQINPDLIAITGSYSKLIFPYFLMSRMFFSPKYLEDTKSSGLMDPNILFIRPEILLDPMLVHSQPGSLFSSEFQEQFREFMLSDLYSFVVLTSYLFNREFFDRPEYQLGSELHEYLLHIKSRKQLCTQMLGPLQPLDVDLLVELKKIYLGVDISLSTCELYDLLSRTATYQFPGIGTTAIRSDFFAGVSYYKDQNSHSIAYFPCGVTLRWKEDTDNNVAYRGKNKILKGPHMFTQPDDDYAITVYNANNEQVTLKFEKGSLTSADVRYKTGNDIYKDSVVELTGFDNGSKLPSSEAITKLSSDIIHQLESGVPLKNKAEENIKKLKNYLKINFQLLQIDIQDAILDPFGNYIRAVRSANSMPDLSHPFSVEGYFFHNLSKTMIYDPKTSQNFYLASNISTIGIVRRSKVFIKYFEMLQDYSTCTSPSCYLMNFNGCAFAGSISHGQMESGSSIEKWNRESSSENSVDSLQENIPDEHPIYFTGERGTSNVNCKGSLVSEGNLIYKGNFRRGMVHGKGKLYWKGKMRFLGWFRDGYPRLGIYLSEDKIVTGRMIVHRGQENNQLW